jgi:hypothetical protein
VSEAPPASGFENEETKELAHRTGNMHEEN